MVKPWNMASKADTFEHTDHAKKIYFLKSKIFGFGIKRSVHCLFWNQNHKYIVNFLQDFNEI